MTVDQNEKHQETIKRLQSQESGLSDDEAVKRREKYGTNSIEETKTPAIIKFLKKLSGPVPWMLEITALITYFLGKYIDTYIILALLVFNSIISFLQESRATDAVELLRRKINVNARVLRSGIWKQVPASELVPGDIIHVRMGDIVPADVKIISGVVDSDQSALTGESNPVRRSTDGDIYSGSVLKKGEATGIVTATGSQTYFGKTTELVKKAGSESHLEKLILSIVKYLVIIDVFLVGLLLVFSSIYSISYVDTIPFALVVLIASIPVALPATFTIATAIGALDMSRRGALVTRLSAVEDAASMDTICFDKTGTLTQNKLSVTSPVPYACTEEVLIQAAILASDESSQDSIDLAIIQYGKENNFDITGFKVTEFIPFDPSRKRTEAKVLKNDSIISVVKGAPQVILSLCGDADGKSVMENVVNLAHRGYRTLGVAESSGDRYKFLGLIPLFDIPRPDSNQLITKLSDLGISAKMVTGDSTAIASEIASKVGIGSRVCVSSDVINGKHHIDSCDVFAEVFPEDKYEIVKLLQKEGHITGMTGDGVNDSPALKQAEVGIAVASATDVAKASASIVLTHEGITDAVSAVEDGRKIYQRMLTYTLNKIIKTIQIAIFLTVSFLIFRYLVTTSFEIILLLFANDFATMSIATDNVRFSSKPERWDVKSLVGSSMSLALLIVVESFIILLVGMRLSLSVDQIHTFIFDMLVFSGQFTIYMIRERGHFWSSRPGKYLLIASVGDILVITAMSSAGILVTAIPLLYVGIVLLITFISMALIDPLKNAIFRHYKI